MSNIINNRVSVVPPADLQANVETKLRELEALFPALISATVEEWSSLPKIDVYNRQFVMETIAIMRSRKDELPPAMQPMVQEMINDLAYYERLEEAEIMLAKAVNLVRDTRMVVGSEAYVAALAMKKMVASFAKMGLPGWRDADERLTDFFKKAIKKGDSQTTTTTNVDDMGVE